MTTSKKGESTWIKFRCIWAKSPKLGKLKRLGILSPAMYLLRAWTWALEEHKGPTVDLDELEEAVFWDGDDGALVAAFTRVGFLKGNRFELWWDEGPGELQKTREKDKKRKAEARSNDGENPQKPSTGKTTPSEGQTETSGGQSQLSTKKDRTAAHTRLEETIGESPKTTKRTREDPETTTNAPSTPPDPTAASKRGEWQGIKQAFLDEYEHRCNGAPPGGGRWGKGFFGDNGSFDVAEYLDGIATHYVRVLRVALPSFWRAWDEKQPKNRVGHYPGDMKGELELYLMSRGLPTPLVRMMGGKM